MKQWQLQSTMAADNQHSLTRLIRAIAFGQGQFALILVRCNYLQLRLSMLENLRTVTKDIYLREIFLEASIESLHNKIISDLHLDNPVVASDKKPDAVMIFGLESVTLLEELIVNINQARDIYAANFSFPLVLWLTEEVAASLSRNAPDFKSWAATTIKLR
ncbi:MAG: hypothetical protein HC908_18720 [Calothrix sp. SM1_7_51]|nr:hypothetical protein [Calothrix sp. SM1_7_51]